MQKAPHYDDAPVEVAAFLAERVRRAGPRVFLPSVSPSIPAFGFGKTFVHNLQLIAKLEHLRQLGVAVLVGASRQGVHWRPVAPRARPTNAWPGSLAAALAAVHHGAHIVRVHDVAATAQALTIWRAIAEHE